MRFGESTHFFFWKVDVLFFPMLIFLVHFLFLHDADLFSVLNRVGNFTVVMHAQTVLVFFLRVHIRIGIRHLYRIQIQNQPLIMSKNPHSWCDAQICANQIHIVCACTSTVIFPTLLLNPATRNHPTAKKRVRFVQCSCSVSFSTVVRLRVSLSLSK